MAPNKKSSITPESLIRSILNLEPSIFVFDVAIDMGFDCLKDIFKKFQLTELMGPKQPVQLFGQLSMVFFVTGHVPDPIWRQPEQDPRRIIDLFQSFYFQHCSGKNRSNRPPP